MFSATKRIKRVYNCICFSGKNMRLERAIQKKSRKKKKKHKIR